jgi:Type IV secretion system pilin
VRIKKTASIVSSLGLLLALTLVPTVPAEAGLFSGSRDAACNGVNLNSGPQASTTNNEGDVTGALGDAAGDVKDATDAVVDATTNDTTGALGDAAEQAANDKNAADSAGKVADQAAAGTCGTQAASTINKFITFAMNLFSFIVGIAAVIMIIVGGLRFVLAGGDPAKLSSARNTIIYSLIGLVVAVLAQVIVRYVLGKVYF